MARINDAISASLAIAVSFFISRSLQLNHCIFSQSKPAESDSRRRNSRFISFPEPQMLPRPSHSARLVRYQCLRVANRRPIVPAFSLRITLGSWLCAASGHNTYLSPVAPYIMDNPDCIGHFQSLLFKVRSSSFPASFDTPPAPFYVFLWYRRAFFEERKQSR
jgi:hypothetical protein